MRYQFGGGGGVYLEGLILGGAYTWRGLYLEGLIHGGAYFRNFTLPVGVILDTYVSKEYSECSNSCVEWA